jgi:glycosyltransferase involved in cell wall biosynthesis
VSADGRRLRVAALTAGAHVPSARFRVAQYADVLAEHGVELEHRPSRVGAYPPVRRWLRAPWLAATLVERVPAIARSHGADVTLLQREFVSTIASLEGLTGRPRVLDVDDAVWLLRRGGGIDRVAAWSDAVICGNDFLAEHFSRSHRVVHVLPTAVDDRRFRPAAGRRVADRPPVIGWTGTSGGYSYLAEIESALAAVLAARPRVRLRIVSDRRPTLPLLDAARVDFVPWSPAVEVTSLQDLTVGIMPLRDSEWERGKCSFKMLLYLACGVPAVVAPVGMNRQLLDEGGAIGFGPRTLGEWTDALVALVDDPSLAAEQGIRGRALVERRYGVATVGARLAELLRAVAA